MRLNRKIHSADWSDIEKFFSDVESFSASGRTRWEVISQAFAASRIPSFRKASGYCLIDPSGSESFVRLSFLKFASPEVQQAFGIIFPMFILPRSGVCQINKGSALLAQLSAASRMVSQSIAQSRTQCIFILFLVPAISFCFSLLSPTRFLLQLSNSYGQLLFLSAVLLYAAGTRVMLRFMNGSHRLLFSKSLSDASGQGSFLRSLIQHSLQQRGPLYSMQKALLDSAHWMEWHKAFFGEERDFLRTSRGGAVCPKSLFLNTIVAEFLRTPPETRMLFIERRHQSALGGLQVALAQNSAALNLRLLLVIAIFFLPALFLMLFLNGTPASPGTLI